jgi:hypothetical protein
MSKKAQRVADLLRPQLEARQTRARLLSLSRQITLIGA